MDILIRGIEMPKGGYRTVEIGFDADGHPMAICDGGNVYDVIPILPHGRLIDADALKEFAYKRQEEIGIAACLDVLDISLAPIIIPAEEGEI